MCKIWLFWFCDFFFSGMSWKSSVLDPPPHKIERLYRNLDKNDKMKWAKVESRWRKMDRTTTTTIQNILFFLAVVARGFSWGDWSSVRSGFLKCLVICKWNHCACSAVALNKFDANLANQKRIITGCYSESSSASRVHPKHSYQWLLCSSLKAVLTPGGIFAFVFTSISQLSSW